MSFLFFGGAGGMPRNVYCRAPRRRKAKDEGSEGNVTVAISGPPLRGLCEPAIRRLDADWEQLWVMARPWSAPHLIRSYGLANRHSSGPRALTEPSRLSVESSVQDDKAVARSTFFSLGT
jgi:hypothetical protein